MPQKSNFVATKTNPGDIYVFDTSKFSSTPVKDGSCTPLIKLKGHKREGYGINWSKKVEGNLVSGLKFYKIRW
jgi:histone-binding protein RBBP4